MLPHYTILNLSLTVRKQCISLQYSFLWYRRDLFIQHLNMQRQKSHSSVKRFPLSQGSSANGIRPPVVPLVYSGNSE
ncbi:hypothetical protein FKM82_006670 [Ascaphus truei]